MSVFYNSQEGFCAGMLLKYDNGAQRSLGQCRIGIDPSESYTKPSRICLQRRLYSGAGIAVKLQATAVQVTEMDECEHGRDGEGNDWNCSPMRGNLEFWFSDRETKLAVMVNTS